MDGARWVGCYGVEFISFRPKVHEMLNFEYSVIRNSIRIIDSKWWTAQDTQPTPDSILRYELFRSAFGQYCV